MVLLLPPPGMREGSWVVVLVVADVSLVASSAQCSRQLMRRLLVSSCVYIFFLFSALACSLSFSMLSWTRGKGCCIFFFSIISLVAPALCGRSIHRCILSISCSLLLLLRIRLCMLMSNTHAQEDRSIFFKVKFFFCCW